MHIKTIVAGAAIALAATIGSASADDQFSTLEGVSAEKLVPAEMAASRAADIQVNIIGPTNPGPGTFARFVPARRQVGSVAAHPLTGNPATVSLVQGEHPD